jgi:hypothetical protein
MSKQPFEVQRLRQIVQRIYEVRQYEIEVSAASLAAEAMIELDPNNNAPIMVRVAADLQFRQVARGILRGVMRDEEDDVEQASFALHDALQKRYPTAHSATNSDPTYILLDHMADEDFAFNIQRLEREADAKTAHARALKDYQEQRRAVA